MFNKSAESFPVKRNSIYLNHCGIAALYGGAASAMRDFLTARAEEGVGALGGYQRILAQLRASAARLLRAPAADMSFMKNTAEGLSAIAAGYPFEPGDEIISYVHEYPSNHYPWLLQERRGAVLKLLPDRTPAGVPDAHGPAGWSMEDLRALTTARTRVIALSHVQFTSGFAADLEQLGAFCRARGIDLILDVAQSLGSLPVHPERCHVAAAAASGWKWLLGPVGCGLLYTSSELRRKLAVVLAGADIVVQGDDYLDHTWQPHGDGRFFEYSTVPIAHALGLQRCLRDLFADVAIETIRDEVFRLQDVFLSGLDADRYRPLKFPPEHRSGILSLACEDAARTARQACARGMTVTARGGYLRIAPHFYNDDNELQRAAAILNSLAEN